MNEEAAGIVKAAPLQREPVDSTVNEVPRDLDDPVDEPTRAYGPFAVVADVHEPLAIVDALRARDVPVERRKIHPADYVVGAAAIERKTVRDFFGSLLRKRLFEQLARLRETYPRPLLLLEGDLSVVVEQANPGAFWGALVTVAAEMGVPIVPSPGKEATAAILARLHARVAEGRVSRGDVRFKPRALGTAAAQKFAVQGLPLVGDVGSERLLEHFGSVRRVYAARGKDLVRVPGIGEKRAEAIRAFLDQPYESRQARLGGRT